MMYRSQIIMLYTLNLYSMHVNYISIKLEGKKFLKEKHDTLKRDSKCNLISFWKQVCYWRSTRLVNRRVGILSNALILTLIYYVTLSALGFLKFNFPHLENYIRTYTKAPSGIFHLQHIQRQEKSRYLKIYK